MRGRRRRKLPRGVKVLPHITTPPGAYTRTVEIYHFPHGVTVRHEYMSDSTHRVVAVPPRVPGKMGPRGVLAGLSVSQTEIARVRTLTPEGLFEVWATTPRVIPGEACIMGFCEVRGVSGGIQ